MTYRHGPLPVRRFAFGPLVEHLRRRFPPLPPVSAHGFNMCALADHFNVCRQTPYQWISRGLSERQADVLAVLVGQHPAILWPDYYDDMEAAE